MRAGKILLPAGLLTLGALLSVASSSTSVLRQSGVAPHPAPVSRSGQNVHDGRAQLYVRSAHLTHAGSKENGKENAEANLMPAHSVGSGLRLRLGENFDLGVLWDYHIRSGAHHLASMPEPTRRGVIGMGMELGYSIKVNPWFRVGLAGQGMVYIIPSNEYDYSECPGPDFSGPACQQGERETDGGVSMGLSVLPSFRVNRWLTLFLGVNLRVMPYVKPISIRTTEWGTTPIVGYKQDEDGVGYNVVASFGGGAEVAFAQRLRLLLSVYYPVSNESFTFGPIIGLTLSVSVGSAPGSLPKGTVIHGPSGTPMGPAPGPLPPTPSPSPSPTPVPPPPPPPPPANP